MNILLQNQLIMNLKDLDKSKNIQYCNTYNWRVVKSKNTTKIVSFVGQIWLLYFMKDDNFCIFYGSPCMWLKLEFSNSNSVHCGDSRAHIFTSWSRAHVLLTDGSADSDLNAGNVLMTWTNESQPTFNSVPHIQTSRLRFINVMTSYLYINWPCLDFNIRDYFCSPTFSEPVSVSELCGNHPIPIISARFTLPPSCS